MNRMDARIGLLLIVAFPSLALAAGDDAVFQSIRRQVVQIDSKGNSYRQVQRDVEGKSTEGGVVTGYYDGKSLRKIVATYYGESGKVTEEYYVLNGSPIFVLRTDYRYNKPLGEPPFGTSNPKVVSQQQDRFYFSKGKLVRWIDPEDKQSTLDGKKAEVEERRLCQDVEALLRLLNRAKVVVSRS